MNHKQAFDKVVALSHGKTRASYACVMRTLKDKEKRNPAIVKVAPTMVFELWVLKNSPWTRWRGRGYKRKKGLLLWEDLGIVRNEKMKVNGWEKGCKAVASIRVLGGYAVFPWLINLQLISIMSFHNLSQLTINLQFIP